jgi:hypothetical protein
LQINLDERFEGVTYRVVEVSLLLKVSEPPVYDGAGCATGTSTGGHHSTINRIRDDWRAGDENHGAFGHRIDLIKGQYLLGIQITKLT